MTTTISTFIPTRKKEKPQFDHNSSSFATSYCTWDSIGGHHSQWTTMVVEVLV